MRYHLVYLYLRNSAFYKPLHKKKKPKYKIFSKEQRLYLTHIYKINKLPDYDILLASMSQFNIKDQVVTKKTIKTYFKNRRYIDRKKK
jgi:hypothetical protein